MRSMSSLLRLRCPGSCFAGGFPDTCWGFVVCGSCFLYSFLCSSLELVPCSCLCSSEPGYCSSIGEHWMSYTGARFVLGGGCCSTEGVVVGGQRPQSFCFLRIHFGVVLSNEHWQEPSRCVLGR